MTESSVPCDRVGKTLPEIDGYTITSVLGQGGMGIVYRAVQSKLNRAVALKVLPAMVGSANPSAVKRFRREATSAARLHHTNIVPIYDFGESRDAYYYAMELIAGAPLDCLLRCLQGSDIMSAAGPRVVQLIQSAMGAMPLPDADKGRAESTPTHSLTTTAGSRHAYFQLATRWIADAAEGLHYAHGQGVIHRDIKPANLILSNDGRVMIADFGLARTAEESSVTVTGTLVGTLRYISPEQAMGLHARIDHRTDIYSLGITMYEALALRPAFPGTDEKELLSAVIARDPRPLRKVEPAIPIELETICAKAIEKLPEARYQSAREMAEDLRRYLQDEPIVARRPSRVARIVKYIKRRKAPVAAVVTAVLLVVVSFFTVRETQSRRTAQRQQRIEEAEKFVELGINAAKDRKWLRAEKSFHDALDASPDHVRSLTGLIWMRIERFKDEPALATEENWSELDVLCVRVLELEPENAFALNQRGIILKNLGRYDDAIEVTEHLIAMDEGNFAAWSNLGAYQALAGRLNEARESLTRGAELAAPSVGRPGDRSGTYRNLAALELHQGDQRAIEHIAAAIKENPDDPLVWILRARARLQLPEYRNAQEALDDAKYADRKTQEKHPLAKRLLAMAHEALADSRRAGGETTMMVDALERARDEAEQSLQFGDRPVIAHLLLAIAEAGLGNTIEAQAHRQLATTAWPRVLEQSDFIVTFDRGELWFESKSELESLRARAVEMITAATAAAQNP